MPQDKRTLKVWGVPKASNSTEVARAMSVTHSLDSIQKERCCRLKGLLKIKPAKARNHHHHLTTQLQKMWLYSQAWCWKYAKKMQWWLLTLVCFWWWQKKLPFVKVNIHADNKMYLKRMNLRLHFIQQIRLFTQLGMLVDFHQWNKNNSSRDKYWTPFTHLQQHWPTFFPYLLSGTSSTTVG